MIQINADVPDDFEEYCEIRFQDPTDEICRIDYLDDLRRAERFKRFITQEEIRSFPSIREEKNNNKQDKEKIIIKAIIDLDDESNLKQLCYSIVFLNDKENMINLQNYKILWNIMQRLWNLMVLILTLVISIQKCFLSQEKINKRKLLLMILRIILMHYLNI